jgi:hypothetical protein
MMLVGPINDETRRKILDTIERLLNERNVEIRWSRGVKFVDDYDTGTRRAEPTNGETFTIEVNGGAAKIEETDSEKLARLMRDEKRSRP